MELSFRELKKRDVINVADGACLGNIVDIVISFPSGVMTGIVVPGKKGFRLFRAFNKSEVFIEDKKIVKIGSDVILVNLRCGDTCAPSVGVGRPQPPRQGQRKNAPPSCPPQGCGPQYPPQGFSPPPCAPNCEELFKEDERIDFDDY